MGLISRVSSRTYKKKTETNMRSSIIRALSTSSATSALPSIPCFGIAGNYAQALHAAASKKSAKDAVATDLANFAEAVKSDKISGFLTSAFVEKNTKMGVVNDVAAKLKLSPLVVNLMDLLAENHRLGHIAEIAAIYGRIMQAESGFTPVKITSAAAAIVGAGNVHVETAVDAKLVGGLVVSIGD